MKRSIIRSLLASTVALLTVLATGAAALAVDEFPVPTAGARPAGITTALDGSIWFTEEATDVNQIGRVLGGGVVEFGGLFPAPAPTPGNPPETGPAEIAVAPDGALWFTETGAAKVGRMTVGGTLTHECTLPAGSAPDGITQGPDGQIWFALSGNSRIGRLNPLAASPCDTVAQFPPTSQSTPLNGPGDIAPGPDGALWFTQASNKIGRIETSGSPITQPTDANDPSGITRSGATLWFTEFAGDRLVQINPGGVVIGAVQLAPGSGPSGITLGPDGALWFAETNGNRIGRISASGVLTNEFVVPTPNSAPGSIAAGPDAVWFTEFLGNKIGRIATSTGGGGSSTLPLPQPPPPPVTSTKKKKCKVPKLRGLTAKKARSKLRKAKCKYKFRGKGRVRSTKPKAGRTTTGRVTVKFARKKAKRR